MPFLKKTRTNRPHYLAQYLMPCLFSNFSLRQAQDQDQELLIVHRQLPRLRPDRLQHDCKHRHQRQESQIKSSSGGSKGPSG